MNKVIFTMRDGSKKEFDGERFTDEDMNRIFHKECAGFCCYDCPVYDGARCKLNSYKLVKVERVVDKCGECECKTQEGADCYNCKDRPTLRDNFKPKPKKVKKTFYFCSYSGTSIKQRGTSSLYSSESEAYDNIDGVNKPDLQFHSIEVEVHDV